MICRAPGGGAGAAGKERWDETRHVAFLPGLRAVPAGGVLGLAGGGYASVTPHAEAYAQTDPADTETASDYQQLRQVLIHLVENYVDQASVDVTRYGDELRGSGPVDSMGPGEQPRGCLRGAGHSGGGRRGGRPPHCVRVHFLPPDPGGAAGRTAYPGRQRRRGQQSGALERAEAEITLQVSGYQPMDLEAFVQTYYQEHLDTVMECPEVSVQLYPKQGSTRIMEIQFQYTNSRETLLQMKQNVQVLLNSALGYVEGRPRSS